jgi:type I restriction enzyme S subunit
VYRGREAPEGAPPYPLLLPAVLLGVAPISTAGVRSPAAIHGVVPPHPVCGVEGVHALLPVELVRALATCYGIHARASSKNVVAPAAGDGIAPNIINGKLSFDNVKYVRLDPLEESKYLLNSGDILFNRTNSAEQVGKSAVFESHEPAVFASYLIRLVANQAVAQPRYVVAYINSQRGRAYIQSQLTRAIGQVNVNAKKIAAMPLPLPNLGMQEQIVTHLDAVQNEVDRMRSVLDEEEQLLDRLERSILEKAFRGEL